ncbi:MAG: flagellar filament capping protein FliD [Rhodocyclales bacterium]|nr:flagellar filament capping protein FliD [Rhodocyclales bacterium]
MATISSAGIGSGLDINGIITKLMAVEQQPLTALDTKEAGFQAKLSAYGSLKGAVSALQTAAHALKSSSLYTGMSAKAADSTVASASAVSTAVAGTYGLTVTALAKSQSLATNADFSSHTSDISATDGKIRIELGTYSGGTFTADSAKSPITLDIPSESSSLDEIRDEINAVNAGVRASVVYVGKDAGGTDVYKLSLTAKDTGAANSMRITVMDSNDVVQTNNTGLAQLSYNPAATAGAGNEYAIKVPAQDAQLTIDGIDITRGGNTITDAITGVTLTLLKEETTTLTIAKDSASVKSALQAFVKAYNDVNSLAHDVSAYSADTKTASILTGDSGVRSLQTALRQMIGYSVEPATLSVRNLSAVGITMLRDGSLEFNASKFDAAEAKSSSDVATMFSSDTTATKGVAVRMSAVLDSMLATNGLLASRTDGINRSIKDVSKQREALGLRLVAIEKRYRAQFTALDTLVASMQQTSSFLTQQLANLAKLSG